MNPPESYTKRVLETVGKLVRDHCVEKIIEPANKINKEHRERLTRKRTSSADETLSTTGEDPEVSSLYEARFL